jgi:2-polyprenyl-3-methyl-5-hydroxy-6-metoxy-1,4-benzoquinol methylase
MRYVYDFAARPVSDDAVAEIDRAAARVEAKLRSLDPGDLPLSELYRRILGSKQASPVGPLQRFGFILMWSLRGVDKPLEDMTVIEVGGGLGTMALLAKELGIGTVVYNDIYDIACHDAEVVAERLGLAADHYLLGDLDELIDETERLGLEVDSVGSYDVIEHVYDIDAYLTGLAGLPGPSLSIAMASGANMYNRRYRNWIIPFQQVCELEGREAEADHYERDTVRAYVDVRREMIAGVTPDLAEADVERLVTHTRGMRQEDIERAARVFAERGELPPLIDHPTNTCDPFTGNWQEHLMNPDDLVGILRRQGYEAGWVSGYFNGRSPNPGKRTVAKAANLGIRMSSRVGIRLAGYYMIHGRLATKPARP